MKKNIFSTIAKELDSFFKDKVNISLKEAISSLSLGILKKDSSNYEFSQWQTLNLIELYYNSKFESGLYDSEGQRKVFLNISRFRSDVASKMIRMGTKDFVFIPEDGASIIPAWFFHKDFKIWAKEKKFGKVINEFEMDLPKYGTAIAKKVGDEIFRVPLRNLRNSQDAKSLWDAVESGGYVIEEHEYTLNQIKQFPEWNSEGLEFEGKKKVYERYGEVSEDYILKGGNPEKKVLGMCIVLLDKSGVKQEKNNNYSGHILFAAEITKDLFPYREVHWKKQDGRWLGVGEIENQFENQISRNHLINIRRRMLLWSSKKVFQSADDTVAQNLVKDVRDGDILKVAPNGQIAQVNMESRNLAEITSDEQVWDKNSDQLSFTFEVATGESLPSGTPFRLGVMLSNAVKSHFDLKREDFGLFLKDLITDLLVPIFKRQTRDHLVNLYGEEESMDELKEMMTEAAVMQEVKKQIEETGFLPENLDQIKEKTKATLTNQRDFIFKIAKDFYKNLKYKVDVVTTGEQMDVASRMETYKSLLEVLSRNPNTLNDPVARKIIERIMSFSGENIKTILGTQEGGLQQPGMPQIGQMPQGGGMPQQPENQLNQQLAGALQ